MDICVISNLFTQKNLDLKKTNLISTQNFEFHMTNCYYFFKLNASFLFDQQFREKNKNLGV